MSRIFYGRTTAERAIATRSSVSVTPLSFIEPKKLFSQRSSSYSHSEVELFHFTKRITPLVLVPTA